MNQKQIGLILIACGVVIALFTLFVKIKDDQFINHIIMQQGGSCYLPDGTCLHQDRDYTTYIVGGALALALLFFGIYLRFLDKTQETLVQHQIKVSDALARAKHDERSKDEFNAFLSGFSPQEQDILKALHGQDGILQSTLRYRTGLSKAMVSLLLSSLEEREIIKRTQKGKTKQVYLRKKF